MLLVLGAILGLAAAAQRIKLFDVDLTPDRPVGQAGLALVALTMLGIGVVLAVRSGGITKSAVKAKYDVFLAAPMASTKTDDEYASIRSQCLEVLAQLRAHSGVRTYYFVGEKLETRAQFEAYDVAAEVDFDALGASRNFVLIYPSSLISSVLPEAGFALARGIPMTLFVTNVEDLPYLLRQAGDLPRDRFPPVHVRLYTRPDELGQIIRNNGVNLFPAQT